MLRHAIAGGFAAIAAVTPAAAAPRGTFQLIPPSDADPAVADIAKIIYLNRCAAGCTFTQGAFSSSQLNITILGTGSNGTMYTLAPFGHGDQVWNDIVACVRETYLPYDVMVTDIDPGPAVAHHEAVVTDLADAIGRDPNQVGGVGPLYGDCSLHDNTVSFTFANGFPPNATFLCSVVAQETAHGFGIEHSLNCADPMTYLNACRLQFFRNEVLSCGEFAVRPCTCGGGKQNVHSKMYAVFGPNPTPLPSPTVTLSVPANGAIVTDGFTVAASGVDRRGLGKAELWLNGYRWREIEATPDQTVFITTAPDGVPDGVIDVEVRLFNDLESSYGTRTVTVTKGAPCATADACAVGQKCEAGKCFWDAPAGELGDACDYPQFCTSEICESGQCSRPCFVGVTGECPMDFECAAAGAGPDGFCLTHTDSTGCCSVGDTSTGALLAQLGLVALVLGGVMRRRPRR